MKCRSESDAAGRAWLSLLLCNITLNNVSSGAGVEDPDLTIGITGSEVLSLAIEADAHNFGTDIDMTAEQRLQEKRQQSEE